MKRKFSQRKPKDPSPIRISFPRSTDNQFNAAKVDEPKTSEYAFFKKLKTGHAGHRHSHALRKEQIRSNTTSRSSEYPTIERSSAIKSRFEDLRMPAEDLSRVDPGLFLSPVVEVEQKRDSTIFGDLCNTSMEDYSKTLRHHRTQNEHEDLFKAKRLRLLQWVTDISFPEIKELCSKGYDFVSVLLSRLFPESKEDNSFKIPMCGQAERSTESKFLTSPHSNIHSKILHHTSTRNFMEVECDTYLESGISSSWLDRSSDSFLESGISSSCLNRSRGRNSTTHDSPACYAQNVFLDCSLREPSRHLGGWQAKSWIESDSDFNFPSNNHGYLPSIYLRELDDLHCPNRSMLAREHHRLLLGWDSQNVTNDTPAFICQDKQLIAYPTSLTSSGSNHDQNPDDGCGAFGASGLSVPSILCKYPPELCPLTPSPSTSYCQHDLGKHFTEDNEYMVADLSHYPLALSPTPNYLCLTEDLNHDIEYKGSRATLLSPAYHGWFSRKVSDEWHHGSGTEALLTSELDFYFERKFLSINESSSNHYVSIDHDPQFPQKEDTLFSHILPKDKHEDWLQPDGDLSHRGILNCISKDMIKARDWSSFNFRMSLEHQEACPLLLDKSSWDEIEGETYHDDSER